METNPQDTTTRLHPPKASVNQLTKRGVSFVFFLFFFLIRQQTLSDAEDMRLLHPVYVVKEVQKTEATFFLGGETNLRTLSMHMTLVYTVLSE